MKTGRYTLKDLLQSSEIGQIIIPELQRDYVWEKKNVDGLLNSIYDKYQSKIDDKLIIRKEDGETPVENELYQYLNREYNKLRYNTRIGFIYAYHNLDYVDKFFLIDGQQRITTLFLVLLAAYKKVNLSEDFQKLYYRNSEPKIDYQVREVSHDFLVNFIRFELDYTKSSFEDSQHYYAIYGKDKTAITILSNYKDITSFMDSKLMDVIKWIDYIENYVEFNYFDTNLSDQGERLYLYMNSRGESLTDQELVKSVMVNRCDNGQTSIDAGMFWEQCQNFFWKNRGTNHNADKGFFEFIKWAVIIHINSTEETLLKSANMKNNNLYQSETEIKEDYIKQTNPDEQRIWIRQYILMNDQFNMNWLTQVMTAVEKIYTLPFINDCDDEEVRFMPDNWLSNVGDAIDYVIICGCLRFLMCFPDTNARNIYRFGMYVKNLSDGFNNRRNPDNATLRVLELVKWMSTTGLENVNQLRVKKCPLTKKDVYREHDMRFNYIEEDDSLAKEYESFFWSITKRRDLNIFLRGNHDFLIRLFADDEDKQLYTAIRYRDLFIQRIFEKKDNDDLRRELLEYGDISVYDNGNSWNLGKKLERWNLLEHDKDNKNWISFLLNKKEDGSYLYPNSLVVVKNYLDKNEEKKADETYLKVLRHGLNYMSQKKYLWNGEKDENTRLVLLEGHQAIDYKAREAQIYMLAKDIDGSWVWSFNYCVLNFEFHDGRLVPIKERNKGFYIDIWYVWYADGGKWYCQIGHKEHSLPLELTTAILSEQFCDKQWIKNEEDSMIRVRTVNPIDQDVEGENLLASEKRVAEWFNDVLWVKMRSLFS